jgi:site-specific DNA-adenine methylase
MKNHFFMPYFGNKRNEVVKIYEVIEPRLENIEHIIEPFCGSSALSFYISSLHPKRFKYILNDNNSHLIKIYKILQDEKETDIFINELNKMLVDLDKEKYNKIAKDSKHNYLNWFFINKVYNIRPGLFPQNSTIIKNFEIIKESKIINFLRTEKITILCDDSIKILNDYGQNKKALIFMDPPYLMSCNDFYNNKDVNIYQHLYHNKITTFTAFVILCLEDVWIIRLLFDKYIKFSYDKKYETSKKKTTHIIITNKK